MANLGICEMDPKEQEDILETLMEELQEFFEWMIEEVGEEYYMEDPNAQRFSWESHVDRRIKERLNTDRARFWERDHYAAFEHPQRPSIYQIMKASDLEILHYCQDDLYCGHFKRESFSFIQDEEQTLKKRYDESFSVLLASESLGYMYRLDLCKVCGLIEIWSTIYNSNEISLINN